MNAQSESSVLILVVDDEADIRTLLRILLEKEGWQVAEAANGREAVEFVRAHTDVSLVILDIMMPEMDGIQTARELRKMTEAPILFLSARSSDADKLAAYRVGGDDYIVKPFYATDLRLKLQAMLRRLRVYEDKLREVASPQDATVLIPAEGIEVHTSENCVYRKGERIVLTDREYSLLCFFCHNRGRTLSPTEIYEAVWEEPYLTTSSNTVIVHIANLRKKLEIGAIGQSFIRTVWGKGYRLD